MERGGGEQTDPVPICESQVLGGDGRRAGRVVGAAGRSEEEGEGFCCKRSGR
jgi:hypothetical protein